jgi:hypothetical protein
MNLVASRKKHLDVSDMLPGVFFASRKQVFFLNDSGVINALLADKK